MINPFAAIVRRAPALRHRNFSLYWSGMLLSIAGSQMQIWSLFWHIAQMTDNPIAVSGIGAARFLPILFFALFGGLMADRNNRRRILFITQSTMALVALTLAVLTWTGMIQLWHIYLLTAIQATAISFDSPARQSLVPNLVGDRRDLPSAFSLTSIAANTGSIIGPALSGVVIATLGQGYTYFFNAVSFLSVLLALWLMGPIPQQIEAANGRRGIDFAAIGEGIRFIFRQPVILGSMVLDFFATFFSSANTLLPFFAVQILGVGELEYGWLSSGQAIGAVTVGLFLAQRAQVRRQGMLVTLAVVIFGAATILFGLSRSFWMTLAALVLVGAADAVSTILRNTIRQLQTPDHIRGRMISITQIFFQGGPQLGEIESGIVARAFGLSPAIILGGIGTLAAAGFVTWKWPQLLRYNGDEPVSAGASTQEPSGST